MSGDAARGTSSPAGDAPVPGVAERRRSPQPGGSAAVAGVVRAAARGRGDARPAHSPGTPFLATDIGGTHARMALVRADDGGAIEVLDTRKYACAAWPALAPIVADFLGGRMVDDAAVGCAGMRRGDTIVSINLPWPVSLPDLRALGIARAAAVNDFVAVAHATQCMGDADGVALRPGVAAPAEPGPVLVVGPGTGFGAALRVPAGDRWLVLASEAGQVSLAPGTARERQLLAALQGERGYVSAEQVVTGPGLLQAYRTLCALDGAAPRHALPAGVAGAAAAGDDPHAAEAVAVFCAQFASLLADTVLVTGATRVFVAGGIVPKLLPLFERSDFGERFLDKGAMRPVLERVPVRVIDHPHKGVIGAASWYLQQSAIPAP